MIKNKKYRRTGYEADRSAFSPPSHRQMCVYVDAHSVYCTLAEILDACDNLSFSSLMVQVLNMILFTATELYELRLRLKDLKTQVNPLLQLARGGLWNL